jgi:hypothetical protein
VLAVVEGIRLVLLALEVVCDALDRLRQGQCFEFLRHVFVNGERLDAGSHDFGALSPSESVHGFEVLLQR